ncbi:HlyD family type I secretion periplasmic adaptor subunit [Halodesulfovibrio spirochaetisodalis]|uniref:Uncharacterized protein n=1 Tax=Halodesulfovibrio spirochaetisodalis TaxID=1560234 RepID=A0A1B7XD45_9BACT|nr:HlyD family type I secretion periplasmic adaptor subunit [Halodesulfovibrio spirochaetisodalis]OBQ51896.1 hypothetical protein SP90_08675 [Halodesulfovibrio spirochaetisodalis]
MRNFFLKLFGITRPTKGTDFLPAALRVTETPPSPTGRAIMMSIMGTFVFITIWACLGKTDVVAIASGKVIPKGNIKTIQVLETGTISNIAVKDGVHVNEGDILIEMDMTSSQADIDRLDRNLMELTLEAARINALLNWDIENSPAPSSLTLFFDQQTPPRHLLLSYEDQVQEDARALIAQLSVIRNKTKELTAKKNSISCKLEKLKKLLPISKKWADSLKQLYEQGMGSEYDWLVREQNRITLEQDLHSETQLLNEAKSAIISTQKEAEKAIVTFRQQLLHEKNQNSLRLAEVEKELIKARRRKSLQCIVAPVSGTVQQLKVHTIGGVIEVGETALSLVPDDTGLELEVQVLNRDIGFVYPGQHVEVKLEAFPYTQYGTIEGTIRYVSADAVLEKNIGYVYLTQISLAKEYLVINDKKLNLVPGMTASAEIKLRKRRLIEFFLSPLLKYTSESMREQ